MHRAAAALDWPALRTLAERHHLRRIVALGLGLAAGLPGMALPPPAREIMDAEPAAAELAAAVRQAWFAPRPEPPARELYRFLASCRERRADRWTMYWRLLFQPTAADLAWLNLPRPLGCLYPVLRPLRLLFAGTG